MIPINSRLQPFDAYLGQIVLHADRLHFVKEVRIHSKAVHFVIRNEDGNDVQISTAELLDGLLEDVEPRIYQFRNSAGWRMADDRDADSAGGR